MGKVWFILNHPHLSRLIVNFLSPDLLKKISAALGGLAAVVLALAPPHTIAYQIALSVIGFVSSHGVLSSGTSKADPAKGSSEDPFSGG